MITVTITPTTVPQADIVATMMRQLLNTLTPPTAQVAEPVAMAKAIEHAEAAKAAKPPKSAPVQKAEAPAATPPAAAPEVTTEPTAPTTTATASPSNTIEYAQVSKAITEMVKANRDHAVATLAKYGAKKGTELKPEDYAAFLKELG